MEKDFGKIQKNDQTEIVVRIDDFGGRVGLTIREFTNSERYTGFTKSGTRIPADQIKKFKEMIASIDEAEVEKMSQEAASAAENPESSESASAEKGQETL